MLYGSNPATATVLYLSHVCWPSKPVGTPADSHFFVFFFDPLLYSIRRYNSDDLGLLLAFFNNQRIFLSNATFDLLDWSSLSGYFSLTGHGSSKFSASALE